MQREADSQPSGAVKLRLINKSKGSEGNSPQAIETGDLTSVPSIACGTKLSDLKFHKV
jgi:hypothetical protein